MRSQGIETEFGKLVELSLDAVCVAGFDGYLKRVNPAFCQMLGYTHEELLSRPFMNNVHPDDRERVEAGMAVLALGDDIRGFECRQLCADGSVCWVEWNTHAEPADGVVYAIGRDVTDRHRTNEAVERLADEQAALWRVATLVAEAVPASELFEAVTLEVSTLFGAAFAFLARFDEEAVVVVGESAAATFSPGARLDDGGPSACAEVLRTGRSARFDAVDWSEVSGPLGAVSRDLGVVSTVASPIVAEGRTWGALSISATDEALPPDTAARLEKFTGLVATAIANAEAQDALARLANEQAALRRVATLVADGTPPAQVFAAAARELAHALGIDMVTIDRYDPDGASTVVASFNDPGFPVGSRWPLDGPSLGATVHETARPARIEDYVDLQSSSAAVMRERSVSSAVGAPILVDGRPWGVICVSTALGPSVPEGVEARLADFTALLATSIARTASRETLAHIAEEQAALRRVATLVAEAAAPSAILDAVAGEMQALLGADQVALNRFEPDAEIVVLAHRGLDVERTPVGSRVSHEGENVTSIVRRTGSPARMENYEEAGGTLAELARATGLRSSVSAPITVEGQVWGVVTASWKGDESPPADTEDRMAKFAHLIDTAIANTEARAEVEQLAEEQAALRRVATLVARGDPPEEIFAAVSREVHRMFGLEGGDLDVTTVVRFDPGPVFVLVSSGKPIEGLPLGSHWRPNDIYVTTRVHRTGRSARVDEDELLTARQPAAAELRRQGVASQVASPIVVEGRLWGAMNLNATRALPSDTEERLEKFTELVATAIANAESRKALAEVVEEQTALRRLATLVAEGVPSGELFSAVTKEVVHVLSDVDPALVASVIRFDPGPESVLVGASRAYEQEPLGARWAPKDLYVSTRVLRTGRSARVDEADLDTAGGPDAEVLRLRGFLYQVGSPVVVEGQLWGAMCLNSRQELPPNTDERLESFTELVATAIANAESREDIAQLVDEQAALRLLATLVAKGVPPTEIFAEVSSQVADVFALDVESSGVATVVRFDPGPECVLVGESNSIDGLPLGSRWGLTDLYVSTRVLRTGHSARVDEMDLDVGGPVADTLRRQNLISQAGSPIIVEGRLWGAMTVNAKGVLPPETEERLEKFTELVATAIANAEAREARAVLTEEQAALRRVATLVARDAPSTEVFEAVATEVGKLLDTDITVVGRYDGDGAATAIGSWSASGGGVPVGTRSEIGGHNVLTIVAETGKPARVDGYDDASGEAAEIARRYGWRSSIAAPVVVEDRLWGVMLVATQRPELFPAGAEERLAAFTDLVATAVANTEARHALERVAAEQATLRRIATLVAKGVRPEEVFAVVIQEVGRLFGTDLTTVGRFHDDPPAFVAVALGKGMHDVDVGTSWALNDPLTAARVFQSARSVRVNEGLRERSAALANMLARVGVVSTVASPIMMEGRIWGAVMVSSKEELPVDTEQGLEKFTELVATAIANAEGKTELAASRRRIVAASDDARRRIERDLHDGVQQQLVSLSLEVGRIEAGLRTGDALKVPLGRVSENVGSILDSLGEIARGIHPSILSQGGLEAALNGLARRSAVPVELDAHIERPLPDGVEVAAYYVVSEALTNVAKHAHASVVHVDVTAEHGTLRLVVRDDGVGGAALGEGSGLVGLQDRVEALGGTIAIDSSAEKGTCVVATLPIATQPGQAIENVLVPPQALESPTSPA